MNAKDLALILAAVRREVAKIEPDLTRPLRFMEGPAGKDGRDGIDGQNGAEGRAGERGPQGPQGLPGRDGIDGKDGKDGRDGIDGKDGQDGLDGTGIADLKILPSGHLIVTLDDGTQIDAGLIRGERGPRGPRGPSGSGGGSGNGAGTTETVGTALLDFGAAPGGNVATTIVTGQSGITSAARVNVWFQGGATADHNTTEHSLIFPSRIGLSAGEIIEDAGFTITAETELRLTGSVQVRWAWSG
jgi:hypothetical protein